MKSKYSKTLIALLVFLLQKIFDLLMKTKSSKYTINSNPFNHSLSIIGFIIILFLFIIL